MGMGEILVVLIVVLLVFGANKIPALGDALGKGVRNFKKAQTDDGTIDVTPPKQSKLPAGGAAAPASGAASESKKV